MAVIGPSRLAHSLGEVNVSPAPLSLIAAVLSILISGERLLYAKRIIPVLQAGTTLNPREEVRHEPD